MKKQWINNFIIMIALGLSSLSVTYGWVHHHYIHSENSMSDWPVYDASVSASKKPNNKQTISDNSSTKTNATSNNENDSTINSIINDKNTIDRLALELQTQQIIKETDEFINEMHERERNFKIIISILGIIFVIGCIIPFILPRSNQKHESIQDDETEENIIQAGLKPDTKEIEELVKKIELLKNDFKNINHQVEINPTMFAKFDLLKNVFYDELNKIDWNKNQNKDLVDEYQLLINHFFTEMNNEFEKINDNFKKIVKTYVEESMERTKIIKES